MKRILRRARFVATAIVSACLVTVAWSASSSEADAGDLRSADAEAPDVSAQPAIAYANPVLPRDFPDPFVLTGKSAYYAFATNGNGKNVQAMASADLVAWTDLPDALPTLPSWAAQNTGLTWAPSVLAR